MTLTLEDRSIYRPLHQSVKPRHNHSQATEVKTPSPLYPFLIIVCLLLASSSTDGQEISGSISSEGRFQAVFAGRESSYYILRKGTVVSSITSPSALRIGSNGPNILTDPIAVSGQTAAYYRVQEVPSLQPVDLDSDGIDDLYELQHPSILDPLNASDALLDPDGNARTHLQEYQLAKLPLSTIAEISPANGESGVSVTRETIIRFSAPLSTNSVLSTANFFAGYGGRKLLARVEFSSDRKTATLFYLEPIPGSTRIYGAFDGTSLLDELGRPIDADGDGLGGGVAQFSFDTLSTTPVYGTAVTGRVLASEPVSTFDSSNRREESLKSLSAFAQTLIAPTATGFTNRPLAGVTITVDGAEETIRTTTDAEGRFVLNNAPAGRFFVHVDGRTATTGIANPNLNWAQRDYYPVVGKAWEAKAGYTNNLANGSGEIFLPLIREGTLQPTSGTAQTKVSFPKSVLDQNPEFRGVELTVPENALMSETGMRGGSIGIAAVPPDRLPEPLPPGLSFPIVITIQTDGPQNFERPVPIRFPNLPDPITGLKLPPGAKSALWSFNHDTGRWELQGAMTASADGNHYVSDPGVGILQPGWHGVAPGTSVSFSRPDFTKAASNCKSLTSWQRAEITYNIANEIASCAADFFALSQAYKCLLTVSQTAVSLTLSVKKVAENLKQKPPAATLESVKIAVAALKAEKDRIVSLFGCFERGINKIDVGFRCAGNAISIGNQICAAFEPDSRPECQMGYWGRLLCDSITAGKDIHTQLGHYYDRANRIKHKAIVNAISFAIDELELIVNRWPQTPTAPKPLNRLSSLSTDRLILDSEARELITALEQASKEISESVIDLPEDDNADLDGYVQQQLEIFKTIKEGSLRDVTLLSTPMFFAVEHFWFNGQRGGTIRGVTSRLDEESLILPASGEYWVTQVSPQLKLWARQRFIARSATQIRLPPLTLVPYGDLLDFDGDGLPDVAELAVGTDPRNSDSDGDGLLDGQEAERGTDPMDGRPIQTGIIASADTLGNAVDIAALNDLAVVADSAAGISIFDISSGQNPVRLAQLDTPGNAVAVAISGSFVLVADGPGGLAIVDVTDARNARTIHQLDIGNVIHIAAAGDLVFAAMKRGWVFVIDLRTGVVLFTKEISEGVDDLAISGDNLYVLTPSSLQIFSSFDAGMERLSSIEVSGTPTDSERKLFVGGDHAYVGYFTGYSVVDVRDPGQPVIVGKPPATQAAIHDIVANGSGLVLATTSFAGPQSIALSLYNGQDPKDVTRFITSFDDPADTRDFSLAIYNGLAYAADGPSGLQVFNYLSADTKGQPPIISLSANFSLLPAQVEEAKRVRLTATVGDDVQVRNVEFYVDGTRIATDGSFPFEVYFTTPLRVGPKTSFTVRALATDTGGNSTWTEEVSVSLLPDLTGPRVIGFSPPGGSVEGAGRIVAITFSEAVRADSLSNLSVSLQHEGADGRLGTSDDRVETGGGFDYRVEGYRPFLTFGTNLPPGAYTISVSPEVTDLSGNKLQRQFASVFYISGVEDKDLDGLPDDIEASLGYQTNNPDSNGNGVLDGDEDLDRDGLPNRWEVAFGFDPESADSNANGIPDGDEDPDGDGLSNKGELTPGTHPKVADTDGDGWDDALEYAMESGPLDRGSVPKLFFSAAPPIEAVIPGEGASASNERFLVAAPPLSVIAPGSGEAFLPKNSVSVAQPAVQVVVPGTGLVNEPGLFIGLPPVSVQINTSTTPETLKR